MDALFIVLAISGYIGNIRRIDVWGLFYRLMVAAFVVGSVVQGSIVYVCWRFRESNPKNRVRESLEGAHQ
jgi:heme/copper-type cytochrome/quinol oxidase subunit 2